jgi:hypothetical protein
VCWRVADCAHMNEQVMGRIDNGLRTSERDHRRMEGDVGVRIFAQMFGRRRVLEFVEQVAERRDIGVRGM